MVMTWLHTTKVIAKPVEELDFEARVKDVVSVCTKECYSKDCTCKTGNILEADGKDLLPFLDYDHGKNGLSCVSYPKVLTGQHREPLTTFLCNCGSMRYFVHEAYGKDHWVLCFGQGHLIEMSVISDCD